MSEFFIKNKEIVHIKMGQADALITNNRDAMSVVNRLADRIDRSADIATLRKEARAIYVIVLEAENFPALKATADATRRMLREENLLTPSGELIDVEEETLQNLRAQLTVALEAWPERLRNGEFSRACFAMKKRVSFLLDENEKNWEDEFKFMDAICLEIAPLVKDSAEAPWLNNLVKILYSVKALRM
ncbi:hypothetical protein HZA87_00995 [Candidatus Uhrbacteria bacterium]|nr:hypothetical protein [Candidatus Uhrbacteria bacterium]